MKIKSYKGPSLEKIYQAIREELGPEAVVLNPQKSRTLGGLLGGQILYEVVAVAEDAEADTHLLTASKMAALSQFEKMSIQNNEQFEEMQKLFSDIKRNMKTASPGDAGLENSFKGDGVPDFAADWDRRFIYKLKEKNAGIMTAGSANDAVVKEAVSNLMRVEESFAVARIKNRPQVVFMTGPTGSGKTTTLAKLAARWALEGGLNVGIITMDTYRVAAVDQIKEYALLLGIEMKVVFSGTEAADAIEYFKDKDVVLVDTPGRNFYDKVGMLALKGMIRSMDKATVMLLVPATLERGNISDLVKSYDLLKPDYLIMTKVDETRRYGALTTLMCESQCPLAFFTNGQRVPQDIVSASRQDMVDMIIGERKEAIDNLAPLVKTGMPPVQLLELYGRKNFVFKANRDENRTGRTVVPFEFERVADPWSRYKCA